jgi:NADH dehydrogenase [ubiquinone] 1 alpha subcomplex assembly factor 7
MGFGLLSKSCPPLSAPSFPSELRERSPYRSCRSLESIFSHAGGHIDSFITGEMPPPRVPFRVRPTRAAAPSLCATRTQWRWPVRRWNSNSGSGNGGVRSKLIDLSSSTSREQPAEEPTAPSPTLFNVVRSSPGVEVDLSQYSDSHRLPSSNLSPARRASQESHLRGLERVLWDRIAVSGPLPLADFMRLALADPAFGYYTTGGKGTHDATEEPGEGGRTDTEAETVFGRAGDFTTAPEVSQMFGEMLAVWCVAVWQLLGSPAKLDLVELGPGRGTMASDIVRVARKFPAFAAALRLSLVEVSPVLRAVQESALRESGVDVQWFDTLADWRAATAGGDSEPNPVLFLAQEFFDALPIHQFQRTELGWCERLVDHNPFYVAPREDGGGGEGDNDGDSGSGKNGGKNGVPQNARFPLRLVLSPGETLASRACLAHHPDARESIEEDPQVAVPSPSSPSQQQQQQKQQQAQRTGTIDVSPQSLSIANQIAAAVSERSGAALVIDYGEDGNVSESLRVIRDHAFLDSPLDRPGSADLSALVDFAALARAAVAPYGSRSSSSAESSESSESSENSEISGRSGGRSSNGQPHVPRVNVLGPVTQGHFLEALGIGTRAQRLVEGAASDEVRQRVYDEYTKLVGDDPKTGMGSTYKVMAFVHEDVDVSVFPGNLGAPLPK